MNSWHYWLDYSVLAATRRKPSLSCLALCKMIVVWQIGRYVLLVARRRSWPQTKCAILLLDVEKMEAVEWANQSRELNNVASLTGSRPVVGLLGRMSEVRCVSHV